MKHRWRRSARRGTANLDVTAFLSLMVILVPFLLITAVFSRITILELSGLPKKSPQSSAAGTLQLVITVREDAIEVSRGKQGQLTRLERSSNGYPLAALASILARLKESAPDRAQATILFEPQVLYEVVVRVMDTVRIRVEGGPGARKKVELFPQIALGEAVPIEQTSSPMR